MKKMLFVLVCLATLGLWVSCNNEAQDVNLTENTVLVDKWYENHGTVTATKVTMQTHRGGAVKFDENGKPNNMPTDGKNWYPSVYNYYDENKEIKSEWYWFYNDWNAGEEVTFDKASITWSDDVYYHDGIVGHETVSNGKNYYLTLDYMASEKALHREYNIFSCDDTIVLEWNVYTDASYGYDPYIHEVTESWTWGTNVKQDFSTESRALEGSLEGSFTVSGALKERDWCYYKYQCIRFDKRYVDSYEDPDYCYTINTPYDRLEEPFDWKEDWESDDWEISPIYGLQEFPEDTSIYYLKDLKFTKN